MFYEVVSQGWPQEETERLRKTKLITLTCPREEVHAGPHGKTPRVVTGRRQEFKESLGLHLYWGFCGKSKTGQVNG